MHSTSVLYAIKRMRNPEAPSVNPDRVKRGPQVLISARCRERNMKWKFLYEEERWTITEIARAHGRHFGNVARALKKVGVAMRTTKASLTRKGRQNIAIDISKYQQKADQPQTVHKSARIERMMAISLKIERRGRGMLA